MWSHPATQKQKPVSLLIKNIRVYGYGKEAGQLCDAYVTTAGRLILADRSKESLEWKAEYIMDALGQYTLMPGMLDAHVHGQGGFDFADAGDSSQGIAKIMAALGATGLSYALATLVSLELPTLKKALSAIQHYVEQEERQPTRGAAKIVGVHLEGPFISKACKGAHAESALQESITLEKFRAIIAAAPSIQQWKITLDPDLPGALRFIQDCKILEKEGIFTKIFIGHSNPLKSTIEAAMAAGASGFTHLGNACQETCSRVSRPLVEADVQSRLVKWVLENAETCPAGVELIVDGVHLSQSFVSLLKRTLGNKIMLVTDALGPSGLGDGLYRLGTLPIRKEENSFYVADAEGRFVSKEGTQTKLLAGSGASLAQCAKRYAEWTTEKAETREEQLCSLSRVLIENPKRSSLSKEAIRQLPEEMNFILLDSRNELLLSLCNGKLRSHSRRMPLLNETINASFSPRLFTLANSDTATCRERPRSERLVRRSKL